jgi:hypothetical protein
VTFFSRKRQGAVAGGQQAFETAILLLGKILAGLIGRLAAALAQTLLKLKYTLKQHWLAL